MGMTREEAIEVIKAYRDKLTNSASNQLDGDIEAFDIAIQALEQEPKTGWIPITTRPMTEEEKEWHEEQLDYVDDAVIFNCPLPDDGQEVLITVYGETELDTFYSDEIDGCYFENRDIEDVRAWMPLPEPYKTESEETDGK